MSDHETELGCGVSDEPYVHPFAGRLRERREQLDMTQAEVAERVGVAQPHVSAWEAGTRSPRLPQLAAIARVLRSSLDVLVLGLPAESPAQDRAYLDTFIARLVTAAGREAAELVDARQRIRDAHGR